MFFFVIKCSKNTSLYSSVIVKTQSFRTICQNPIVIYFSQKQFEACQWKKKWENFEKKRNKMKFLNLLGIEHLVILVVTFVSFNNTYFSQMYPLMLLVWPHKVFESWTKLFKQSVSDFSTYFWLLMSNIWFSIILDKVYKIISCNGVRCRKGL